ncbi:hypothetical protein SS50377_20094 [Spironucleus salmonicida]|uniref:Uncharacterized protein n=1 Tax=Spironucleus salmonicida TaxID=348837 RepID=V6LKQ9_9EUKA|nr:hypothetical protein SS50377_20094 [Spironucleus salmonicida]|eukprot:EST45152.1 hypothetical protein SS50377_14723 [Spironucleus salmonicida]
MLQRHTLALHKNRKLKPLEILDQLEKQSSSVSQKLSILPDVGFSLFHQTLTYWTDRTPYFPLLCLQQESETQYLLLEQVLLLKDEILLKIQNIIQSLFTNDDNPELTFDAYHAICQLLPDLVRDIGEDQLIHKITQLLRLDLICENMELYYCAMQCLIQCIQFTKFEDNSYFIFFEFMLTQKLNKNDVQQYLIADVLAYTIRRGYLLDYSQFKADSLFLCKVLILAIRRPTGTLHSKWQIFLSNVLFQEDPQQISLFLHYAVNSGFQEQSMIDIMYQITENYSSENIYNTVLNILIYSEFTQQMLDLQYFQKNHDIMAFSYYNISKSAFKLIPLAIINEISSNYLYTIQFFELLQKQINTMQINQKQQLFAQITKAPENSNKYIAIIIASYYLDQQIPSEFVNQCLRSISTNEDESQLELLFIATQNIQITQETFQDIQKTNILSIIDFDNIISQFISLLNNNDPTQFTIAAQVIENNLTTQDDLNHIIKLLNDQQILEAVIEKLTSKYTRIRAKMIDIISKIYPCQIFQLFKNIFNTQDMLLFKDIQVKIQIAVKQNQFDHIQRYLLIGMSYGFIFQRNGIIQQNISQLLQVLYSQYKNDMIQVISWSKLPQILIDNKINFETIDLEEFENKQQLSNQNQSIYKEFHDERIINHVSKEKQALITLNTELVQTQDQNIIANFSVSLKTSKIQIFTENYQKFGIKFASQFQVNAYLSLNIQQVRKNLQLSFWSKSTKFLFIGPQLIIQSILTQFIAQLLNDDIINIHHLQFIMYAILASPDTIYIENLIFIAQFAAVEPVLPEIIFACCVITKNPLPFHLARLINLQTCGDQLLQTFFGGSDQEYSSNQVNNNYADFNEFYKICTILQKGEQEFDYGGKVVIGKLQEQNCKQIIMSLLISRATRSSKSQSITGVGQACVGKVGKEYIRKRRVQQFVIEKLQKGDQHIFFNGQLLAVFKNLFGCLDLYNFIVQNDNNKIIQLLENINLRKIHSFLRTYSAIRQSTSSIEVDCCILKLMYSIILYCENRLKVEIEELALNSLKECLNFAITGSCNIILFTIFEIQEDNLFQQIKLNEQYPDLEMLNVFIHHLITQQQGKQSVEYLMQNIIPYYNQLKQFVQFNINFLLPLIQGYYNYSTQIFNYLEQFEINDLVMSKLVYKVNAEIKKASSITEQQAKHLIQLINIVPPNDSIISGLLVIHKNFQTKGDIVSRIAQYLSINISVNFLDIVTPFVNLSSFYGEIFIQYYKSTQNNIYLILNQLVTIQPNINIDILEELVYNDVLLQKIFFNYCITIQLYQNVQIMLIIEKCSCHQFYTNLINFISTHLQSNFQNNHKLTNCLVLLKAINKDLINEQDVKIGLDLLNTCNMSTEKKMISYLEHLVIILSTEQQLFTVGFYGTKFMTEILVPLTLNYVISNKVTKFSTIKQFFGFIAKASEITQYFTLINCVADYLISNKNNQLANILLSIIQVFRFSDKYQFNLTNLNELERKYYDFTKEQLYLFIHSVQDKIVLLLGFSSGQTNLLQILSSSQYDINIFQCLISIISTLPKQQIFQKLSQIQSILLKNVVQKEIEVRSLAVESLKIIVKYCGVSSLEYSINLLLQHYINDVFKVFYMTNTIYDLVQQLCIYSQEDLQLAKYEQTKPSLEVQFKDRFNFAKSQKQKNTIIVRNILTEKAIALIIQSIETNLFSSAQTLLNSELFFRFVKLDNVYKLIQLLISTVTYSNNQGLLLQKIIFPLILKAINYKNIYVQMIEAIIRGLQQNSSVETDEILDLVQYLNDDTKCSYCLQKPQSIQSFRNRQNEILTNSSLTTQEKVVQYRNAHQLLDTDQVAVNRVKLAQVNNISYDINMCIFISVSLIVHHINIRDNSITDNENKLLLSYLQYDSITLAQEKKQTNNYILDNEEHLQYVLSILDLAIYSNSDKVLSIVYQIIIGMDKHLKISNRNLPLSNQFITQSINQLNFITELNIQKNIYEFLIKFVLRQDNLSVQIKDKILKAAIIQTKIQENNLYEPFQIVDYFIQTYMADFTVSLIEACDFYLNFSIFKLANQRSTQIRNILSVLLFNYMIFLMQKENQVQNKLKGLIKLTVEAENMDTKIMALNIIKMMLTTSLFDAQFQNQQIAFVAMIQGASGVVSNDLRQLIAETFLLLLTKYKDLSIFNQMFTQSANFYFAVAELLWRSLSLQKLTYFNYVNFQIKDVEIVSLQKEQKLILNFLESRKNIIINQLGSSQLNIIASIHLAQYMSIKINYLELIQVENSYIQEAVIKYCTNKQILDWEFIDFITQHEIDGTSNYFKSITLQCDDLPKLILAISKLPEIILLDSITNSFSILRNQDENKVLEFGAYYFKVILKFSEQNKQFAFDQVKQILSADEIYDWLLTEAYK